MRRFGIHRIALQNPLSIRSAANSSRRANGILKLCKELL
jgi:hypothetical protein